jgi:hypothetical protein
MKIRIKKPPEDGIKWGDNRGRRLWFLTHAMKWKAVPSSEREGRQEPDCT